MRTNYRGLPLGLLLGLLIACADGELPGASVLPPKVAPVVSAVEVERVRHDPAAFTQGLLFHDGLLLESTGGYGSSTLRKVDPANGAVIQTIPLEESFFAEGIAVLGDSLFQLTWRENTGFIYDPGTLERIGTFGFAGEGWGLTSDGVSLILSNGSDLLQFIDRNTFRVQRELAVRDGEHPVHYLNELEWVEGEIWANIWNQDEIARIDPLSGIVLGWVDLAPIAPSERFTNREAVTNGIAFDAAERRLYVTGKLWPVVIRIDFDAVVAGP
jgi:glutaminyl-peptide cyclotransferase